MASCFTHLFYPPEINAVPNCLGLEESGSFDCLIVISPNVLLNTYGTWAITRKLLEQKKVDASIIKLNTVTIVCCDTVPHKRLIYVSTGSSDADMKTYEVAAKKGIERAIQAGAEAPLFLVENCPPEGVTHCLLGALEVILKMWTDRHYRPVNTGNPMVVEAKEIKRLGLVGQNPYLTKAIIAQAQGLFVAQYLVSGEPREKSTGIFAKYVRKTFLGSCVSVNILGKEEILAKFPVFANVKTGVHGVPYVIKLNYVGGISKANDYRDIYLIGNGVVHYKPKVPKPHEPMRDDEELTCGTSMEICGAAAVVGFFRAIKEIKPKDIHVTGYLLVARHPIYGPPIKGTPGERDSIVRELQCGIDMRNLLLEMVDSLYLAEKETKNSLDSHIITFAALNDNDATLALGPYPLFVDNTAATRENFSLGVQSLANRTGEVLNVTRLNPEELMPSALVNYSFEECILGEGTVRRQKLLISHVFDLFMAFSDTILGSRRKYTHVDMVCSSEKTPNFPILSLVRNLFPNEFNIWIQTVE